MALFWISCAFVLGVVVGGAVDEPLPLWLGFAIALAVAGITVRRTRYLVPLLVLASVCLGAARAPHGSPLNARGTLPTYNGRIVAVDGVVDAEPDIRDTGANYRVAVSDVQVGGTKRPIHGRIAIHTSRAVVLDYGDRVTLRGRLLTPRNSAQVPYADILARQGVGSEMRFPRIVDSGPGDAGISGLIMRLRTALEVGINAWLPEPEAALLIAITLGAKTSSLGDLAPVLIKTGLIHIVAISGIKVALVAGTVYELARLARNRLFALLASLSVLAVYVLLTGATESGLRSALMWTLVFLAAYLGRRTVALVSLSFVVAVMVALQPFILSDIGFLLSAIGTGSIVAFADPTMRVFKLVPPPFREALSVTIAAQIGTAPIVAIGFRVLSLTGPLANGLALPLLPALIALGFLVGAVSALPSLAAPLASAAYVLTSAVIWVSRVLSALPGAIPVPSNPPPLVTMLYYAALSSAAVLVLHRSRWAPPGRMPGRAREFGLALVMGASGLTLSFRALPVDPPDRLISLGSGEAVLLQSHGSVALIDGSPRPFQLLEALGQRLPPNGHVIDIVVVTDPRASNVEGLLEVLAHYRVGEVLDVGAEYPSSTYARWRAELLGRGIPAYGLRTGATVRLGHTKIVALAPDALYADPRDSAGMLKVLGSRRSVLLASAVSTREMHEALFRPIHLRADVLVVAPQSKVDQPFLHRVGSDRPLLAGSDFSIGL